MLTEFINRVSGYAEDVVALDFRSKASSYIGRSVSVLTYAPRAVSDLCKKVAAYVQTYTLVHFGWDLSSSFLIRTLSKLSFGISKSEYTPRSVPFPAATTPAWTNHRFLPRRVKKEINYRELEKKVTAAFTRTKLSAKTLQEIQKNNGEATHFGTGIRNGNNTCYIAAVIQSLRFIPRFRESLQRMKKMPLAKELLRLMNHIEGKNKHEKRPITEEEIRNFRRLCMDYGWWVPENSQQDAREFWFFLFNTVCSPNFTYRNKVSHGLDIPFRIKPFNPLQPVTAKEILFPLELTEDGTETRQLARNAAILEKVKKEKHIDLPEDASQEDLEKYFELGTKVYVTTHQALHLYADDIPHVLPLTLKREKHDKVTKAKEKLATKVLPSTHIEIPLLDTENSSDPFKTTPTHCARYVLKSIVASGTGTSTDSGHWRTFVPIRVTEKETSFVEFNDGTTKLYVDPQKIGSELAETGTMFFYEFIDVVPSSASTST